MPSFNIIRIVVAIVIAVIVGILLVGLLGPALTTLKVPIAEVAGRFFEAWGYVIGVLVGLIWYFRGGTVG